MFLEAYQQFVTKVLLYWNTSYIIPKEVSWRNNDFHLLDPSFANFAVEQKTSLEIEAPTDVPFDLASQSKSSPSDI